jgi:hypothetical protein
MQAAEVVVALVFVDISVHVSDGGLLVAAAIAFFTLAVTAQGPLGIFRICGQRLHLIVAMAVAVAVALAPIIPALRPDVEGIIVVEFGAIGLIRLATFTQMTEATAPLRAVRTGPRRRSRVIDATATVADASASSGSNGSKPGGAGSKPGASRSGDSTPSGAAARWAGRTSGAAASSGKRVAAKYQPEAGEQVKRTIRGVGRLAGRLTSRLAPPEDHTH